MRKLHACGFYRSGSTFAYNLLKRINEGFDLGYKMNKKEHNVWFEDVTKDDLSVYTYRDIRNVTASFIRFHIKNKKCRKVKTGHYIMSLDGGKEEELTINNFILYSLQYDAFMTVKIMEGFNVLKIRYENEIFDDCKIAITKVLNYLKAKYEPKDINTLESLLSVEKVKKEISTATDNGMINSDTFYCSNHIYDGISDYKSFFTEGEIDNLPPFTKNSLKKYCLNNGYEFE